MNILIDERIRNKEEDFLKNELNLNVEKIRLSSFVYPEISGHSDIFYAKINNKIYCSPNAPIKNPSFIIGKEEVKNTYPDDVKYNICQIGNNIIGSKYADKEIIKYINIFVKQGYAKCNISVTGSNSCLTSDIGIYKELIKHNIDVTYIDDDNIHLLDKNNNISKMKGFIGGASFVFNNYFVVFGDINNLEEENKEKILNHLEKYKLKLKTFEDLDIIDYGGAIIY